MKKVTYLVMLILTMLLAKNSFSSSCTETITKISYSKDSKQAAFYTIEHGTTPGSEYFITTNACGKDQKDVDRLIYRFKNYKSCQKEKKNEPKIRSSYFRCLANAR